MDSIDDLLNGDLPDSDLLPDDIEDNGQIFDNDEQITNENQDVAPIKVLPKKRNVLNPRPRLNVEVLRSQRGLHTIEDYFKDIKYKGKGREKEDLDEVIRRLQHWGHRMYPTYKFDDVLTTIERLGKKKPLQVHMSRYRLGMLESMKNHEEINDEDGDLQHAPSVEEPYDEFDALLDEQIAISKVDPRTPASSHTNCSNLGMSNSTNMSISSSTFATAFSKSNAVISTPYTGLSTLDDSDLATPLPPSQPSTPDCKQQLTVEQLARIAENRRLAQERLSKRKQLQQQS